MNSTEAIQEAIQFIQRQITCEIIDGCDEEITEDHAHMQEVISQLQQLPQYDGSNYGTLWSIEDLRIYRPAWDDDTLTKWFTNNGNQLGNQATDDGREVIKTLLDLDGMCEGCGEDSPGVACAKCEDDYEITVCIKCDHVMRREHLDDDICQMCN